MEAGAAGKGEIAVGGKGDVVGVRGDGRIPPPQHTPLRVVGEISQPGKPRPLFSVQRRLWVVEKQVVPPLPESAPDGRWRPGMQPANFGIQHRSWVSPECDKVKR